MGKEANIDLDKKDVQVIHNKVSGGVTAASDSHFCRSPEFAKVLAAVDKRWAEDRLSDDEVQQNCVISRCVPLRARKRGRVMEI